MIARAQTKRAYRMQRQADRHRITQEKDLWCCRNGLQAVKRGCMGCVRQLHRITKQHSTNLSPISGRSCAAAIVAGNLEVLRFVLPVWIAREKSSEETVGTVVGRNLMTLAAMEGTMETVQYLRDYFSGTNCWASNLCGLLARDGRVEQLMYVLENGATWSTKDRCETARRIDCYDYTSDHAECCRIAGSAMW